MYYSIKGRIINKKPTLVIIENQGISYEIHVSLETYKNIGNINDIVQVFTYLYVKEDVFALYGFSDLTEKELFLKLINVSGIGPKMGLSILSSAPANKVLLMITNEDVKRLCSMPGIGKKTAGRLILELKDPLTKFSQNISSVGPEDLSAPAREVVGSGINSYEAVMALVSLGFSEQQARNKVQKALAVDENVSLEELIKRALK